MSNLNYHLFDANNNREIVPSTQALLRATNKPEEVDEDETVIEGFENPNIPYFGYYIENGAGVVHVSMAGVVPFGSDASALAMTYSSTRDDHRRQGLATEGNTVTVQHGLAVAKQIGKPAVLGTAETTSESRGFWDSVHFKRAYLVKGDKKLAQVKYWQGALDFGDDGLPTEEAGEVAEHMAYREFVHGVTLAELIEATNAIRDWSSLWGEDDFDSAEAYQAHLGYNEELKDRFLAQFEGVKEFKLLTASEVADFEDDGWEVEEFAEADEVVSIDEVEIVTVSAAEI